MDDISIVMKLARFVRYYFTSHWFRVEGRHGINASKERLTVLLCSNPLLLGKVKDQEVSNIDLST